MKVIKIISGGQTGADRGALIGASNVALPTGGTAPRGYRTERGDDPTLKEFGVVEHSSREYVPRTRANVHNSDGTVWFGKVGSPGYHATKRAADLADKPFLINPTTEQLKEFAVGKSVLNIAGNRESKNPGIQETVRSTIELAFWNMAGQV